MLGVLDVLQVKENVLKFLAAGTHLGGTNLNFQMEECICKRKSDGIYIINLKRTWEKLLLAGHADVAVENLANVSVLSSWNTGWQAVLKFAAATGASAVAGHFTSGTSTNQIRAAFWEPRLLVVTDPKADHQPPQRCLMSMCLPLLCVRLSSVLCGHYHPLQQGSSHSGSDVVDAGLGSSMHVWHCLP